MDNWLNRNGVKYRSNGRKASTTKQAPGSHELDGY